MTKELSQQSKYLLFSSFIMLEKEEKEELLNLF